MVTAPQDEILLELVDADGVTTGLSEKLAAHEPPGRLHRAFSVFLFAPDGRMLLQRRALAKYHSPGVWSNTCCGHPFPGEPPFLAATRRTFEELGVAPTSLSAAGTVTYRHVDPVSELIEHEFNHLFVGRVATELSPDDDEVCETAFVDEAELARLRADMDFSSWFGTVFDAARPAIAELTGKW
ncbi:isopentenyl-diphosphate Delta-isomerase [Antrihabitans sp. YC2-6]|nr:isopentenyl-diphosphate Delta-isomerase [Antrihabitans sp. YC2-6]